MQFEVHFINAAVNDLVELHAYIAAHDSPARAVELVDRITSATDSLAHTPARGHYPTELSAIGVQEYRELLVGPYRIIYRVAGKRVYIMLVADCRRDLQALLQRRLLDG